MFLVDEAHYTELCSYLKKVTFKKDDFFLKEGEYCRYVGFLKCGLMRSFYNKDCKADINVNFHLDHSLITDYDSILFGIKSKINIKAIEDSEVFLLHKNHLQDLYRKDPYWQEFGRKMAEVVYLHAKRRVENLLCRSPEQRYHQLLLENPKIFQLMSQKHIASYLGIQPQSLSRIKRRIQKR
ncbi:Crp/Fnr family transcriptional regulator [Chryseobacterium angstadtii]|uniref:Crp/Fnr family transcriptional regulator n=1 Tax=Chryseobacterium angstadtii TaxID=558151 RepID=A0A0J7I5N7_9FLAO|nr:Crp/Fnr family transcriptional regulator [Chryseobacterium angstadtii]